MTNYKGFESGSDLCIILLTAWKDCRNPQKPSICRALIWAGNLTNTGQMHYYLNLQAWCNLIILNLKVHTVLQSGHKAEIYCILNFHILVTIPGCVEICNVYMRAPCFSIDVFKFCCCCKGNNILAWNWTQSVTFMQTEMKTMVHAQIHKNVSIIER